MSKKQFFTISLSAEHINSVAFKRTVLRYPITIVGIFVLLISAFISSSHNASLSGEWSRIIGFAPHHLFDGELYRIASSMIVTRGSYYFWISFFMFAGCVGVAEDLFGTKKVILIFLAAHLFALLITSVLIASPLHSFGLWRGSLLYAAHDVGPSAGYYGCLGSVLFFSRQKGCRYLIYMVWILLAARLSYSWVVVPDQGRVISGDLAHILAFGIGMLLGRYFTVQRLSSSICSTVELLSSKEKGC
ncbi:MAG: rhomboid family intramembrane serine protease [Candidatus Scalindua sp.]|nr:rhomboid family intramembrane serine protease [Candidatus Scalindua sp.]MCR4344977.1 rhomboid family intramembrane serine protease [Candidatus Scalindua sp.]